MLALFAISTLSFLVLFLAVLALLRRAKAEGARLARHSTTSSNGSEAPYVYRESAQPSLGPSEAPAVLLNTSLSSLVPDKQPDWRFMVRDRRVAGRPASSILRQPGEDATVPALRSDRQYFREDMGDLSDPYEPAPSNEIRRAG